MVRERKEKAFHFQGFSFLGIPEGPSWAEAEPCVGRRRQKESREGGVGGEITCLEKEKIPRPL